MFKHNIDDQTWVGRSQVTAHDCQRQDGIGYPNCQHTQSSNQKNLTPHDLLHWLVNHEIHRSKIDGQCTKFLFDILKQKSSSLYEQNANVNEKNKESEPLNQTPDFRQFIDPEPLE